MLAVMVLVCLRLFPSPAAASTILTDFDNIAKEAERAREGDRLADALNLYTKGVHVRPTWAEGWWWLGSILYDQDRFAEAETPLKRFIALSPKPGPGYAFLALCEYETRDYRGSLQHFTAWAEAGSPGSDALLNVAQYHWALALTREGRFDEALYILASKANKVGESPALTEAMGLASLRMAVVPENYPPEQREAVWLAGMAAFYSAINDYRRSNFFAARLLLHFGDRPNVHYFRGTLLGFQREWDAAAAEFQKELEISPHHAPALIELANSRIQVLQPEEALTPAKRAVVLEPNNPRGHYVYGQALLETGLFAESAQELEIAKRLAPQSARIRFALSSAYKRLGRTQDAKREEAAFLARKDKEEVLAPPDENLKAPPAQSSPEQ